jgi:hypothetical protein
MHHRICLVICLYFPCFLIQPRTSTDSHESQRKYFEISISPFCISELFCHEQHQTDVKCELLKCNSKWGLKMLSDERSLLVLQTVTRFIVCCGMYAVTKRYANSSTKCDRWRQVFDTFGTRRQASRPAPFHNVYRPSVPYSSHMHTWCRGYLHLRWRRYTVNTEIDGCKYEVLCHLFIFQFRQCELCCNNVNNKKFWEELIGKFPFIRHGPHRKRRVQQFFNCCVYIRCSGNVLTEPLSSNDKGTHM